MAPEDRVPTTSALLPEGHNDPHDAGLSNSQLPGSNNATSGITNLNTHQKETAVPSTNEASQAPNKPPYRSEMQQITGPDDRILNTLDVSSQ